ncbi:iron complex transport system permease protein [Bartonella sp. WD16.2]|nr:iron complex transport system permease protein [Bartonella sp. WD16.2]
MINSISKAQMLEIKEERHATRGKIALLSLIIFLIFSILVGLLNGASNVSFINLIHAILTQDFSVSSKTHDYLVFIDIRFPRIILGLLVGSALAVSGVLMQGIFRNPLADPGVVGVSAGASLGAVLAIVVGVTFPPYFYLF